MRVLFVVSNVTTDRRLDSLVAAVEAFAERRRERHDALMQLRPREERQPIEQFLRCFRFCRRSDFLSEDGRGRNVLTDAVWRRANEDERRAFYEQRKHREVDASSGSGYLKKVDPTVVATP